MSRRNDWGRGKPAIPHARAVEIARAVMARLEPSAETLALHFTGTGGGCYELHFGKDEAIVVALVDRTSGEAIVDDLRPLLALIGRAEWGRRVPELERILRVQPELATAAAAAIVRIRSEESEGAVRRMLAPSERREVRGVMIMAVACHADFSAELLLRAIENDEDDPFHWDAEEALRVLRSRIAEAGGDAASL